MLPFWKAPALERRSRGERFLFALINDGGSLWM
jgi:hypothetical protein